MADPHPPESLIQYDVPMLEKASASYVAQKINDEMVRSPRKPVDKTQALMREALNAMVPPRKWKEESGKWQQDVSLSKSSRGDVIQLQEGFEEALKTKQARVRPVCPIREEVHGQLLDELIRQVTLSTPERGLLLTRIRDELRMTIQVYQTLYQSSVDFGLRKTVQAEEGMDELSEKIQRLQVENQLLNDIVSEKTIQNAVSLISTKIQS